MKDKIQVPGLPCWGLLEPFNKCCINWACWCTPVMLGRWRQEDQKFEIISASLETMRTCPKDKTNKELQRRGSQQKAESRLRHLLEPVVPDNLYGLSALNPLKGEEKSPPQQLPVLATEEFGPRGACPLNFQKKLECEF